MLTREDILSVQDIMTKAVDVPEWGGTVYVRNLSGKDRDAWELLFANGNPVNVRATLVAKCACDESGERLFGDTDITELGKKSAAGLDRIFEAATKLNRIAPGDLEELAGNSDADLND